MHTRIRLILALAGLLALGAAAAAAAAPVANETLIPKRGVNSCLIDPRFRIHLDGLLGCVVDLSAAAPATGAASGVQPLVNFRRKDSEPVKTVTEEVLFHSLLSREQSVSISFLEKVCVGMGGKDQVEVTTTERPSVSIAYRDIDIERLIATFSPLPAERKASLAVIIGLTPCVVSTAVYTDRPANVGGTIFGVKVGRTWLYKSQEDRHDFYLVAVYAPVALLLSLAQDPLEPAQVDVNLLLNDTSKGGPFTTLSFPVIRSQYPLSERYDPVPRGLWGAGG